MSGVEWAPLKPGSDGELWAGRVVCRGCRGGRVVWCEVVDVVGEGRRVVVSWKRCRDTGRGGCTVLVDVDP